MPKKLTVGLLLDDTLDTPDGVQQYVLAIGGWLTKQGHDVHYLVGRTSRNDINNVHSLASNARVSFNQNKLSIPYHASNYKIKKTLDKINLDVLHVQMPYNPLFAGKVISAVNENVTIIGTFHIAPASWLVSVGGHALKYTYHRTIKRFNEIVSVSSAAQEFAKNTFNIDTRVIPNAVDIAKFTHKPANMPKLHVVYLGRLVQRKGCIWLLKALKELKDSDVPEFTVTIASNGPLMDKLKKYTIDNNLENVQFVGFIDEDKKPALLASADIAVFPSTGGESFGIVLIEAMAAGSRVVLGGDNVGYKSVLKDYPMQLINPKDSGAFAKRLHYFLTNTKARQDAMNWNHKSVLQYDVNMVGSLIEKTYFKHKQ